MFDCHVHTNFSSDSNIDIKDACDTAIKKGLDGIAITDHLDIDFPDFEDINLIDFDEYFNCLNSTISQYKGKINVLKGIEVGIQPHVMEDTKRIVEKYNFDIVISSIHVINGIDLSSGAFCCNQPHNVSYTRYLEEVIFSIDNFKDYDVLGHLDFIKRCGCYDVMSLPYIEYKDIIDTILSKIISSGKGIEVNTSGFRYGLASLLPDLDVIKRYKELGGEIICTGSDAHSKDYIAYKFDYLNEMLSKAGFRYTTYFKKRKPIFIPIR